MVAYDAFRQRATKWRIDGQLEDDFLIEGPSPDSPPYSTACSAEGKFAVVGWPKVMGVQRDPGPYRPVVPVGISDRSGVRQTLVGQFPGSERLRTANNDRPHPFGRETAVAIGRSAVIVATADSYQIHRVGLDGERSLVGPGGARVELTRTMREQWVDDYLARAPADQRFRLKRDLLDSDWLPDAAPAYSGILLDSLGYLWVSTVCDR